MFKFWRRKPPASRRTALVRSEDGCALATTSRRPDGRYVLEACLSVDASAANQQDAIVSWLAVDRSELGPISSVLADSEYQLLLVESPDVLPAELKAAVRWRLKDNIDFPVESAVVDVFSIPEQARRTGARMLYAIAAKREAVDEHVASLKSVAPGFDVIDIPEMALRNLAARMPEAAEGLIFLWLNPRSAQLLVIKQATLYLARTVQFGAGSARPGEREAPDVDAIALELQRSMDYFESHYEQAPIGHLVLAPPGDAAVRLAAELASQTAMRIQILDAARLLEVPPEVDLAPRNRLLAIGAALRGAESTS